jgi:hypothetical protein
MERAGTTITNATDLPAAPTPGPRRSARRPWRASRTETALFNKAKAALAEQRPAPAERGDRRCLRPGDREQGVWSPGNVGLLAVIGRSRRSATTIRPLNVDQTGGKVQQRRFATTGKGTLVRAADVAGNDNEWRYVRWRLFIMIEEST